MRMIKTKDNSIELSENFINFFLEVNEQAYPDIHLNCLNECHDITGTDETKIFIATLFLRILTMLRSFGKKLGHSM